MLENLQKWLTLILYGTPTLLYIAYEKKLAESIRRLLLGGMFLSKFRWRFPEMFLAKRSHIIDRETVFLRNFRYGQIRHDNISEQFFLLFLYQPLLGRNIEGIVEFPIKSGMGHLKFHHQLLYRADPRIYFQHPVFEIVIRTEQWSKHSGKLFFLVQSP